jgi:hypothetical protein
MGFELFDRACKAADATFFFSYVMPCKTFNCTSLWNFLCIPLYHASTYKHSTRLHVPRYSTYT